MMQCYFLGDNGMMHAMTDMAGWVKYKDVEQAIKEAEAAAREKEREEILLMVIATTQITPMGLQCLVEAIRARGGKPSGKIPRLRADWNTEELLAILNAVVDRLNGEDQG